MLNNVRAATSSAVMAAPGAGRSTTYGGTSAGQTPASAHATPPSRSRPQRNRGRRSADRWRCAGTAPPAAHLQKCIPARTGSPGHGRGEEMNSHHKGLASAKQTSRSSCNPAPGGQWTGTHSRLLTSARPWAKSRGSSGASSSASPSPSPPPGTVSPSPFAARPNWRGVPARYYYVSQMGHEVAKVRNLVTYLKSLIQDSRGREPPARPAKAMAAPAPAQRGAVDAVHTGCAVRGLAIMTMRETNLPRVTPLPAVPTALAPARQSSGGRRPPCTTIAPRCN